MTFANINIGSYAGDNTGDPLRTAFDKINKNFANIATGNIAVTLNAPVQSVAGRIGNISLNVNDVAGAVGLGKLSLTVDAANVASRAYTDSAINNLINSAPGTLDTLGEIAAQLQNDTSGLAALTTIINTATNNQNAANVLIYDLSDQVSSIAATSASQATNINVLNVNAAAQSLEMNSIRSDLSDTNDVISSVQSEVDTINVTLTNLWANASAQGITLNDMVANAATQNQQMSALRANITAANAVIAQHTINIADLVANAASQGSQLIDLVANAAGQATSLNVLTANAASQAISLNSDTANAAAQGSVLNSLLANAVTQQTSIQGALDQLVAQAETVTELMGDAVTQAENINSLNANVTAANVQISSLWGNAATQGEQLYSLSTSVNVLSGAISGHDADISTLTSNATTQQTQINSLQADITAANVNITTNSNTIDEINTTVADLVTQLSDGPISITGNVIAGNIITRHSVRFPDGSIQTTAAVTADTGNITFSGDTIGSVDGEGGITINATGNGEIHLSNNTGIDNVNPAFLLEIGNITENENTGAVGINFNNNVASVGNRHGSAIIGWDWWDNNGHGSNDDGTDHARFGIYDGSTTPFTKAWLSFDKSAPSNSIAVDANGTVNTLKVSTNIVKSNIQVRATVIESSSPSATEVVDILNGIQWLHTQNAQNNFVFNIRGSNTVSLNNVLSVGETVQIQYSVTNGSSGYYCTGVEIDGNSQSVKWLGGVTPTNGSTNGVDLYSFIITKIDDASFVVLAQQQKYS